MHMIWMRRAENGPLVLTSPGTKTERQKGIQQGSQTKRSLSLWKKKKRNRWRYLSVRGCLLWYAFVINLSPVFKETTHFLWSVFRQCGAFKLSIQAFVSVADTSLIDFFCFFTSVCMIKYIYFLCHVQLNESLFLQKQGESSSTNQLFLFSHKQTDFEKNKRGKRSRFFRFVIKSRYSRSTLASG